MRGPPLGRSIPAWVCILAACFAGCAANSSLLEPYCEGPEAFRTLVVIPEKDVPEFNVVRIGHSRFVGALQGGGRGFLRGSRAAGQGQVMVPFSGPDPTALAAVAVTGVAAAIIGGVIGSGVAAPYRIVSEPDDATRKRLGSLRIQERFARMVEEEAAKRLPVAVSYKVLPGEDTGGQRHVLRELRRSGIDGAFRTKVALVGFEGPIEEGQPLYMVVATRTDILRTEDREIVFETTLEYRGEALSTDDWVKDDFARMVRELEEGMRDLAKRCVDDIVDAHLILPP